MILESMEKAKKTDQIPSLQWASLSSARMPDLEVNQTADLAALETISLPVYRLLEKKLGNNYTYNEILSTLRSMQVTLLSKESGYIPSYKRTVLTDDLHKAFGFHTDYEFITNSAMRSIIKRTKTEKVKK